MEDFGVIYCSIYRLSPNYSKGTPESLSMYRV
uniref:Uncharacterized protein n=1 Tax=Arundo donax TaxID=35708 RepID=A0A0A9AGM4_ARUDO